MSPGRYKILRLKSFIKWLGDNILVQGSPDVNHGHPWFNPAPDIGADLPMCLGCLPEITPHLLIGHVQRPLLFAGGPPRCTAPGGR